MIILSIETSGNVCGVTLSNDKELIAEYSVTGNNLHDKLCSELIRRILNDFELRVNDLDAVAVSAGPGSFTGLRIGISIAKALCFKANESDISPLFIAVPTLTAIANNYREMNSINFKSKALVAIKAQKDSLYYQTFDFVNNSESEIMLESVENFNNIDFSHFIKIGPYFLNEEVNFINQLSAIAIAKLAIKLYQEEKFEDPETFTPFYQQEFQVKIKRKFLDF